METNINQTCFCGKSLTKRQAIQSKRPCLCCGKQYNPNEMEFYGCNQRNQCKFQQISAYGYVVCAQCFNSKNYDLGDSGNDFTFNKTKSNMKIISDKLNKLTDIQQRKKCMDEMCFMLYQCWIAKLKNELLTQKFNDFYNEALAKIKNDMDAHELELNDDIFTSNSNKQFDPQQLAEMNKISLEWFGLTQELQVEEEKTEKKMIEFEDIECPNIYKCVTRKKK
eukprot:437095_1